MKKDAAFANTIPPTAAQIEYKLKNERARMKIVRRVRV